VVGMGSNHPCGAINYAGSVREEMIPVPLIAVFVSREFCLVFHPARDAGLVGENR
jgi:hypothetical protein